MWLTRIILDLSKIYELTNLNVLLVSFRGILKESFNSQNVLLVNFHAHENLSHKQNVSFYDVSVLGR